jgi:hypothetical protein
MSPCNLARRPVCLYSLHDTEYRPTAFLCPFDPVHVRSSTLDAFARRFPPNRFVLVTFLLPKQLERINDELVPSLVVVLVVRGGGRGEVDNND